MQNPKVAWSVASALQESLSEGSHSLSAIPKLICRLVREELWRSIYCEPLNEVVEFGSFAEFVADDLPTGLGTDIQTLKNLCRDDKEARKVIDFACKRSRGNKTGKNQHTKDDPGGNLYNIQDSSLQAPTGTSLDACLRRLAKDRPDLLEQVEANQISANAAMIQAGFRKKLSAAEQCVKAFRKAENRLEPLRVIVQELEPHEVAVLKDWIENGI